ncbi:MAG: helix-turn-helix domain-containing protein [Blautia obeum]
MLDIAASNSIVAIQLKKAITQKGLKQASVANKAGYSAQELNDMLNGRRIRGQQILLQ